MGVHQRNPMFAATDSFETAWNSGLDRQAQAFAATYQYLGRIERAARRDLLRRLFEVRQTVYATARWDTLDEKELNARIKQEKAARVKHTRGK